MTNPFCVVVVVVVVVVVASYVLVDVVVVAVEPRKRSLPSHIWRTIDSQLPSPPHSQTYTKERSHP
jgi:hypothetical protein